MSNDEYRFRFHCDTCDVSGDWVSTAKEAGGLEEKHHRDGHSDDYPVSSRIQRFPVDEIVRGDVR